jgi:hypothetical protein
MTLHRLFRLSSLTFFKTGTWPTRRLTIATSPSVRSSFLMASHGQFQTNGFRKISRIWRVSAVGMRIQTMRRSCPDGSLYPSTVLYSSL